MQSIQTIQTIQTMEDIKYYTFIYCITHDDGCVIKGNHHHVPGNYSMIHSHLYDSCEWNNMGVILDDGEFIDIIKQVRINYDKFGGKFKFNYYIDILTNELGYYLHIDKNTVLYNWIQEKSKNMIDTFINKLNN